MLRSKKIPTVRFNLKNDKDKKESLIFAMLNYGNKKRLKYSTGEKVPAKFWDSKSQRVKNVNASSEYVDINDRLDEIKKVILNIYKANGFDEIEVSMFRQLLNEYYGKIKVEPQKEKKTFIQFVESYIEQGKKSPMKSRGTWKTWQNNLNLLKEYCRSKGHYNKKTDTYSFDYPDINWDFRNDYENWLYNTKKHSINYASKVIQVFTQFLNESNRRGEALEIKIHKQGNWHIKKAGTAKFRLRFDELQQLYKLRNLTKSDQLAIDLFLIGAYSGLRYSDFSKLKKEYIYEKKGKKYLKVRTEKTSTDVVIPIFQILEALLVRYDFTPPYMPAQRLNVKLKELAKAANLDRVVTIFTSNGGIKKENFAPIYEKLTSHCARRSFASNFYELGIPAAMLMQITGHSTEKQFFNYICIQGEYNAEELFHMIEDKFNVSHLKAV